MGKKPCDGCRHITPQEDEGHCYLFERSPPVLPCTQHDIFKAQRETMGRMLNGNNAVSGIILSGMIASAEINHNEGKHVQNK